MVTGTSASLRSAQESLQQVEQLADGPPLVVDGLLELGEAPPAMVLHAVVGGV